MSEDWASIAQEVSDALGDFTTAELVRPAVATGGDPWKPTLAAPQIETVNALQSKVQRTRDGSRINEAAEKAFSIDAVGLSSAPTTDDKLTFGGVTYTVLEVDEIAPAGVPVMYKLMVAK